MKEEEKLIVIKKINDIKDQYNSLKEKINEINELKKDEKVKKYFKLEDEIIKIKNILATNPVESKIVDTWFSYYIHTQQLTCEHDIWIYCGSFYVWENIYGIGRDFVCECDDENDIHFQYNKYKCVECDKIIEVSKKDWKKFEQEHVILNKENEVCYSEEYYQLLYENPVQETQKTLINKYGKKNNIIEIKTKEGV